MLPALHPERASLHNEVHARPPEAMAAPLAIAHLVMLADGAQRTLSRQHLATLLRDHHVPAPDEATTHLRVDLGAFRLRWELHTEFVTWTFTVRIRDDEAAGNRLAGAFEAVPQEWLAGLPGQCLSSLEMWVLSGSSAACDTRRLQMLREDALMGSAVADHQSPLAVSRRKM